MTDATHQQGFAHAMARMHMWLSGDDPELLVDYPQCRPIWAWCLAHNLTYGAALCRSFRLGFDEGFASTSEGCNGEFTSRSFTDDVYEERAAFPILTGDWRPGCGRSAS